MNSSNTLILSLFFLLAGAATGAGQDTIPTPLGEERTPQLAVEQWVQPNEEGLLIGQIVTVDDRPVGRCDVALVGMDDVVRKFSSDDQGKVKLRDIPPGIHAVVVRGENLIATYALHVVGRNFENISREATFAIGAARVDAAKFYGQIVRQIPAGGASAIPIEGAPGQAFEPAEVRSVVEKIGQPGLLRVQQVNGGLEGCLYAPGVEESRLVHAPQTNVFVLREGLEVDRAVTDAQGCYRFEDMAPGRYSFVAVGQSGIAATGFELVNDAATADSRTQNRSFRLASAVQPPGIPAPGQLDLQIAPPQAALAGFEALGPPPAGGGGPPPPPVPPGGLAPPPGMAGGFGGGGPGGGFGGGGAGGGGMGGIGGLLGVAGLAAGVAALSDEEDFEVPRPASPARPGPPAGVPPGPPAGVPPGNP